ncbi:hypothetical protein [Streptomyces echinatus]|uniref:hypothetical protein n=1 Tax=Streptomyces echinatus TaxID=67293 RepID=UPI00379DC73F
MYGMLEKLGTRLLERFVPKVEAAAALPCWWECRCVKGDANSGCASTGHTWWQQRRLCNGTGAGPWQYYQCGPCYPGEQYAC